MTLSLSQFFSSAARTRVLEALCRQPKGVSLRQLSALIDTPIRSVALAAKALAQEKILIVRRKSNRTLYVINPLHPQAALIREVCRLTETQMLRHRALQYTDTAKLILPFNAAATHLLRRARTDLANADA